MTNRHCQLVPFALSSLLALLIAGCVNVQPPVVYYNLTPLAMEHHQQAVAGAHNPLAIGLGPVLFPETLDEARIAYRLDPQRLKYDDFHRWSGPLADDFTNVLMENIAAQLPEQATIALFPWGSYFQPTHRLTLNVSRFDGKLGDEVVLTTRWTMTNASGKKSIISRKSTIRVKTAGNDYQELVTALSQAVADLSSEITGFLGKESQNPVRTD
ncbi:MAG: hypothetical protein A2511_06875 [Deltaproteobacteria bacterium RIFOXYD12_FULL_50_9]|nr:MAG: hypothetical protein A2511_06875 [Deltaproteobacteria bacterium RIFOXYD12_FULL_50_9]